MSDMSVTGIDPSLASDAYDDSATARQLNELTQRFVARLDHITAMLERMELDERRMTPLHRRNVTRELRQGARECREALSQFSGWLGVGSSAAKEPDEP